MVGLLPKPQGKGLRSSARMTVEKSIQKTTADVTSVDALERIWANSPAPVEGVVSLV